MKLRLTDKETGKAYTEGFVVWPDGRPEIYVYESGGIEGFTESPSAYKLEVSLDGCRNWSEVSFPEREE